MRAHRAGLVPLARLRGSASHQGQRYRLHRSRPRSYLTSARLVVHPASSIFRPLLSILNPRFSILAPPFPIAGPAPIRYLPRMRPPIPSYPNQPGKSRIPLMACLCATIFCLLLALTALVVAKSPPRHLSATDATKTARTLSVGSTVSQGSQVTAVPPFVGSNSETWDHFGVSEFPTGTSILGVI